MQMPRDVHGTNLISVGKLALYMRGEPAAEDSHLTFARR
jgi:hypothetical protein